MIAAVDAGVMSAIAVALCGLIGAVVAAVLNYKGSQKAAKQDEVAAVLASYDQLVDNLRTEAERCHTAHDKARAEWDAEKAGLLARIEREASNGDRWERRYREQVEQNGELTGALTALRAIVIDEVARTAAADTLDGTVPNPPPAAVEEVKRFIRQTDREQP